ncbi:MAG: bifunctional DNA-binding transcriptional regulator/O6-methylguanine-DNA methyltransferase Ada [Acidobacteria bacterium]|nr:bifunctional DNA-binding transcriptional regulator/O6-methylguanine-DNA methyltransferase Ada [Acidobacteriota bacterium]
MSKISNVTTQTPALPGISEDTLWQAVRTRDASFDGVFYYGVRTTGVYCRPGCASRQPQRANVSFFALPEAAQSAGLRACKRCRPEVVALRDPQAELIQSVCRLIDLNLEEPPSLARLGQQTQISQFHLQRLFKKLMGITPREYSEARRNEKFKAEIQSGRSVTGAMYEAGYGSSSRLYEKAAVQMGMTPATYRKGGAGMLISFTIAPSPLGQLLVAATEKGLCAVRLGDDAEALVAGLRAEFHQAEIQQDTTAHLSAPLQTLLAYLAGQLPHPALPLDVQGTAFQKRVWEELRRIPVGETASYSEVAERIGQPTATRAVARACATNPVALVIPCHRVLRADGNLSGYRWGRERKQKLLRQESNFLSASGENIFDNLPQGEK